MLQNKSILTKWIGAAIAAALIFIMPTSCDIYEDIPPCPRGLSLDFVYDYNMEKADAFHSQVDCLTLFIYNEEGSLVTTITEGGEKLKDKDYRLNVDLEHGKYHLVAYGGMACQERSFEPVTAPFTGSKLSDLKVKLLNEGNESNSELHNFFYGSADLTVEGELYKEATISMMKNTNNIRVLLQHINGSAIDADDFNFSIIDDNTLFDADNNLLSDGGITYLPWLKGNAGSNNDVKTSVRTDVTEEVHAAFAEFSTSRLVQTNKNRLLVTRVSDGQPVFDVPLNEMLMLLKSMQYEEMGNQEFLDRQSNWSLVFFLTEGDLWYDVQIIVNGWTIRLNETDF